MRFEGQLRRWNDDRGFGFIMPSQGGQEVFVHISAFPQSVPRPQVGEWVSFELHTTPDGKKRAVRIMRAAQAAEPPPARIPASRQRLTRQHAPRQSGSPARARWRGKAIVVALLAIVGGGAYLGDRLTRAKPSAAYQPITDAFSVSNPAPQRQFSCDGRTRCPQMTSCEEATFFLKHCPGVQMDGDGDGVPCEEQWCH